MICHVRRLGLLVVCASAVLAVTGGLTAQQLPGTKPLEAEGDMAAAMVDQLHVFLSRENDRALEQRSSHWMRNLTSADAYQASIADKRARFAKIIGAVDRRIVDPQFELVATTRRPALVGRGEGFDIFAVRWPVLDGIWGEGLLLQPTSSKPIADVIALPDADFSPEMLVGLEPGVEPAAQFARHLAASGCRVVVPLLIDRKDTFSVVGNSGVGPTKPTNQPHREFIYRQAYEMGRHVIGYEVQKILAAVDCFTIEAGTADSKIAVVGYGEGGLLALYAGALDRRIDVTAVCGYFDSRQDLWTEPIYRNVWSLLWDFGDAELASLIAPRALIVEACRSPQLEGTPPPREGRSTAAPGKLATPPLERIEKEVERARTLTAGLPNAVLIALVKSGDGKDQPGTGLPGSKELLQSVLRAVGSQRDPAVATKTPQPAERTVEPAPRMQRQVQQMVDFTQRLMSEAEFTRAEYWKQADATSLEAWEKTTAPYRDRFYNEIIGRFDQPFIDPQVRTRKVYDEPKFVGYEVQLDVFPNVFAYGILLIPRDVKEDERRPCVVCQHGLEGRPQNVADPQKPDRSYNQYACRLAERGYIVYAPQNPYIGQDRFRSLQRKANPLGKSLFSMIIPQHQATVDWLATLPMVDPARIAFYGLSYGGKTAMRVPAVVTKYCLSICSADFNQWIWKNVSARSPYSYLATGEYEMFEFDLGNTFNYAEMAYLIAPRPFMVERGHHDGVAPDEWVAFEYAKIRRKYAELKIPERTTIEFFDGPHTIHGVGTFEFLDRQLKWTATGGTIQPLEVQAGQ